MKSRKYNFYIPEVPDYTHYKYITTYEGSVRDHIFLRAEHLLRIVANFHPNEITIALRFIYNPAFASRPQDRLALAIEVRTESELSSSLVDQIICYGPLAEFYKIVEDTTPFREKNWEIFNATTEIIRLEEGIEPSSPHGLDIHRMIPNLPDLYYCIHPFKPRTDNDFLMFDKACSSLTDPAMLEVVIQPVSQLVEMDNQYREIVRLMAVSSYSRDTYFTSDQDLEDPFLVFDEEKTPGEREMRAKDPIADEFLKIHRDFHRILRQPQLSFNIKAWATSQETSHFLASTAAECAFDEGRYRLLDYGKNHKWFQQSLDASKELQPFLRSCYREIWDKYSEENLFTLAHMTSVDEFKGMFRLPVAGFSQPCCLWKSTDYHRETETKDGFLIGHTMGVTGDSTPNKKTPEALDKYLEISNPVKVPVTMPVDLLAKHMFVAGVPGSGKTTAVFNILIQLFMRKIPFLVIEPGKTEYRKLKMLQDHPDPTIQSLAKELRIYTPGKDEISPFRFNPFQYPQGITTDEHIGQLLACFEASMPLGGPLQALLAESIEAVYEYKQQQAFKDKKPAEFPTMAELVGVAKRIMDKKGYVGEVRSNLSAAIEIRLSSLTRLSMGKIFGCHNSIPSIKELLKYPTIIEIQNLNAYQSCLLILFLLSNMWEEIRINRRYSKNLQHVTVIEEAHNIVGRTDQAQPSEEFADPKAYAAEYIVRMLAEIRALGEGIIIADQLPTAVASSVVKNTGTKLAHRLVSLIDREDLGGAMLLHGPQMEEIARLKPGQAYYYTEGLYAPRQIVGLNAYDFLGLEEKEAPDSAKLSILLKKQSWFEKLKKERYAYLVRQLISYCQLLDQSINKSTDDLNLYLNDFDCLTNSTKVENSKKELKDLRIDIIKTKNSLEESISLFLKFVKSLPEDITEYLVQEDLDKYNSLANISLKKIKSTANEIEKGIEDLREKIEVLL